MSAQYCIQVTKLHNCPILSVAVSVTISRLQYGISFNILTKTRALLLSKRLILITGIQTEFICSKN